MVPVASAFNSRSAEPLFNLFYLFNGEQVLYMTGYIIRTFRTQASRLLQKSLQNTMRSDDSLCILASLFCKFDRGIAAVGDEAFLCELVHGGCHARLFYMKHGRNVTHLGFPVFPAKMPDGFEIVLCAAA